MLKTLFRSYVNDGRSLKMQREHKQQENRQQRRQVNPYVGPRPFTRNPKDRNLFFGRNDETDEIISLIYGRPLVLAYAPLLFYLAIILIGGVYNKISFLSKLPGPWRLTLYFELFL
jgi:hypothetical protein